MTLLFTISFCLLLASLLCGLYRLVQGPRILDQILAFDYICICILALIALRSIYTNTEVYLELILIFSLLGFATVISFMEIFFARLKRKKHE